MLISRVHFDFFVPKEAELQVRRLQKKTYINRQSQVRSEEIAKNKQTDKRTKQNKTKMLGTYLPLVKILVHFKKCILFIDSLCSIVNSL